MLNNHGFYAARFQQSITCITLPIGITLLVTDTKKVPIALVKHQKAVVKFRWSLREILLETSLKEGKLVKSGEGVVFGHVLELLIREA